MAKAVYFIRRVSKGNQNYSYAGVTHAKDDVAAHRKVLKDFVADKAGSLKIEAGEQLAIKNMTDKGPWGVFTLTRTGQARFEGWQ